MAKRENRNHLLAMVHIGKKHLGLDDVTYRGLLEEEFGVDSAKELTIGQLGRLIDIYRHRFGWRGKRDLDNQALALRQRCVEESLLIRNGEKRLRGLVRKFCGVARIEWCRDPEKLMQVVKILGDIKRKEGEHVKD